MKVLFAPTYVINPHYETELELIENSIEEGHQVFILHCSSDLPSCELNPKKLSSVCYACCVKRNMGLNFFPQATILTFPVVSSENISSYPKSLSELKDFYFDDCNIGMGVASSLISRFEKNHKFDVSSNSALVKSIIDDSIYIYKQYKEVLNEVKPDLVYIFNGRFYSILPLLLLCKKYGIKYITHERSGTFMKYGLWENAVPHEVQYYINEIQSLTKSVSEEDIVNGGSKFFIDRRNKVENSWLSFTKKQQEGRLPNIDLNGKRLITIFGSTVEEYEAIIGFENSFDLFTDAEECLEYLLNSFVGRDDIIFVLRMHPHLGKLQNAQVSFEKELALRFDNLYVVSPDDDIDTYALLEVSEKIIVFGSTLGVEACFWGVPSISLRNVNYRALDCSYWPKSRSEIIELINNSELKPKPLIEAFKYGYWELNRGHVFKNYKPLSLFNGIYKYTSIELSLRNKFKYYFLRILELFEKIK